MGVGRPGQRHEGGRYLVNMEGYNWSLGVGVDIKMVGYDLASLVAQTVERLPEPRETWVPSLGREDPLEKEMATHSSTLAWKIP